MAEISNPQKPAAPAMAVAAAGDPASKAAVRRLGDQVSAVRSRALQPLLHKALSDMRAGRRDQASLTAIKALEIDETSGLAWHILAICREKSGDFTAALAAYEAALRFSPDEPEVTADLARLALKMDMAGVAEGLLKAYLAKRPGDLDGLNNLGIAQRDQMKFSAAIETLRGAIQDAPGSAMLWNTLGSVLTLQGHTEQALVFYDEALRLAPSAAGALYNRAMARLAAGLSEGVVEDFDAAIASTAPAEAGAMRVARAWALLALGDLPQGWAAYEARHDAAYEDAVDFVVEAPAWRHDQDLAGRTLLLIGEQGIGDEVLFAQIVPDVIRALGPDGKLILAVAPRLVSLFARGFPQAEVGPHASFRIEHRNGRSAPFVDREVDAWAPLGQPLRRFRPDLAAFGGTEGYLKADPHRMAHWRDQLATLGSDLKVGVLWKSLLMDAQRLRYFAPFEAWAPVLATPGVTFVNLQYGDVSEAEGAGLWTPPGLDLKDDLEGVAALCGALDLVIGPSNLTTNLAGAIGAAAWLIRTPGTWTRLGSDAHPWYPQARVFTPPQLDRWPEMMGEIAEALKVFKPRP